MLTTPYQHYFHNMAWLSILAVLILVTFLLKHKKNKNNLPPSPPQLPIIGNLHQLGKLPYKSLQTLSRTYGDIMLLRLGTVPTLIISSSHIAKQVLKTHDLHCCDRPLSSFSKKLSYNFLDIVSSPYTDEWKERRKLLIFELLSPQKQHLFWHARYKHMADLLNLLSQNGSNPVNLSERVYIFTDGVVGTAAFGKSYGGKQFKDRHIQDVIAEAIKMFDGIYAENLFPSGGWIIDTLMGTKSRTNKCFVYLDEYFQLLIDEHRNPSRPTSEPKDLVDTLISLSRDQNSAICLKDENMKAIFMNIFLGATDTTALTLVWVMTELMRKPMILNKVQAEIRGLIGRKVNLEEGDIVNLKYLKLVLMETLRMHPPGPLLVPHETRLRCNISGYDIEPRTRILINVAAMARDPKFWNNPDEFYPERFQGKEIAFKGQDFDYLPFGSGRRMCPGITTGMTTLEFALANLLYHFDWEMPSCMRIEDICMEEHGSLTVHKKAPLFLVPVKYEWKA